MCPDSAHVDTINTVTKTSQVYPLTEHTNHSHCK